jgi:hypothetical protein
LIGVLHGRLGNITVDEAGIEYGGGQTQSSAVIVIIQGGPPGAQFSVLTAIRKAMQLPVKQRRSRF